MNFKKKIFALFLSFGMFLVFSPMIRAEVKILEFNVKASDRENIEGIESVLAVYIMLDKMLGNGEVVDDLNKTLDLKFTDASESFRLENYYRYIKYNNKMSTNIKRVKKLKSFLNSEEYKNIIINKDDLSKVKKKLKRKIEIQLKKLNIMVSFYKKHKDVQNVDYKKEGVILYKKLFKLYRIEAVGGKVDSNNFHKEFYYDDYFQKSPSKLKKIVNELLKRRNFEYNRQYISILKKKLKKLKDVKLKEVKKAQKTIIFGKSLKNKHIEFNEN